MKGSKINLIGNWALYTLLCVCIFVGFWALIGFMLYDFNYLSGEEKRGVIVIQLITSLSMCFAVISLINIKK
tara:strand:- start:737 stop:952 length:216 start_codon:yes stop_codon:yes gene_type:complete